MNKVFRQGAVGALLDEYERAILDLQKVIANISDHELTIVIDSRTTDINCRSIQAILSHVVSSGCNYAINIQDLRGHYTMRPDKKYHLTVQEYIQDLTNIFSFAESILQNIQDRELEQFDNALKIMTSWGQLYDIEQMMEHAIVHILRHRRQIEKLKLLI